MTLCSLTFWAAHAGITSAQTTSASSFCGSATGARNLRMVRPWDQTAKLNEQNGKKEKVKLRTLNFETPLELYELKWSIINLIYISRMFFRWMPAENRTPGWTTLPGQACHASTSKSMPFLQSPKGISCDCCEWLTLVEHGNIWNV